MRALLAGGGTGGHLVPGLAIAGALRARGGDALFVTAGRAIESALLRGERSAPLRLERGAGAPGSVESALRLPLAVLRARSILRETEPDVVLGLGGLASFPVVVAARSLGVPVALLEINAVPGRATRWLKPFASRILVACDAAARALGPRAVVTGAPLRPAFGDLRPRADAKRAMGLDPDRPALLVLGGSQGAAAINRAVGAVLDELDRRRVQLVWVAGPGKDSDARGLCAARPRLRARVFGYLDGAADAFAAADLAVCRSGAATVSELAAAGLPAIAIPYPHHRDRQQLRNAELLGEGARVLEERDLTPPRLASEVGWLLENPPRLAAMAAACRRAAKPRALEDVVDELARLAAPAARVSDAGRSRGAS